MARMNVGAATAAHHAHQAGASCAGSLAAQAHCYLSPTGVMEPLRDRHIGASR